MEFNQNCLLCLAKSDCINSIKDTKIGCHSLRDVIMQHFWFKLNETIDYPDTVCSNCYDKLTNFHEYYLYVKEIHSNYDETKTSIKLETPSADIKDLDVICKLESPKHSEIDNFDYQSSSSSSDSVAQMNGRTRKILTNQKRSSVGRIKRQQNRKYLNDQRDRILELFVMACDLCDGIKFNSLEDACKHYRTVHGKDGYLICCGKRHKYAFRIAEHLRYHENPEEFKCKLCEKSFIDKRALSYHMEVHVPKTEKLFKCKYCEKSYSKNVTLKKHVRASHPNGSGKPVESFQCDECGRKFCFKGSLRSHIDNAHRKLYSKICEICAQVFKQSQAYELHYKVMHTMELKRVQCEQCGSWFKHNESLRIHKRSTCVKTGKSETCTVCGKIAPSRSALNIHIRRSHNSISKSFPCTICEKVFKRTTMLKEHMALHTGEILYTCSFCSKTFRSSANMYRHYKVTHPVEYKEKKKIFDGSITYPTTVCSPCCAKVSNFHEYYEFVRTAHINYTNSTSTKVQIKAEGTSEEDGLPNLEPPLEHTTVNVGSVDKTEEDITSDNEEKYDYRNRTSSSASDGLPPQKLKKKRTKSKNKMLKGKRNSDAKNSIGTQSSKPKLKLKHHTKHILEDKKDKLLALFNMNCDQCPITFYSLEDARKHYRSAHNREGYLICCEKKYRYAFQIAQHLRYHENPEEFQCKICKKIFIDKKSISDHMESHVPIDERLFKCEYCTRSYSKRVALKKHLNASHPNGSLKPPKSFNCPTCNQKFSYKTSLRTHINNVHLNRNTKMCAVCAKVFTTVHAYEFHYKVMHTNEMKRVQCNTCGVWLKHCEGLRVHKMKTCSGEDIKAETCAQCGKISPNRKASLAHIRRVHNSDNIAYPCTICGKTFKRTTTLREHMAIHTGETLYTCAFCPKTFRSHANMYKHYKDTHPVENEQRKLANNGPQLDQVINGPQMDQVINGPQMEQANNGPQLDHLV